MQCFRIALTSLLQYCLENGWWSCYVIHGLAVSDTLCGAAPLQWNKISLKLGSAFDELSGAVV